MFNSKTSRLVCGQANVVFFTSSLGRTRVCVQHPSTPAICGGLLSCLKFIRRWIPKGMLPHFGRKIHHLHGISRTHNQQTSPGESFAGGASNKWLWHRPPEHHCNPATAPYLSLFGVSSPSMRPQLGCHPRSPTIQVPQNKASENSWHGMEWYGMVWKPGSSTPSITSYIYICIHDTIHIYRFDCSDEQLRREKCSGKSWILYFKCQESC